MVLQSPVFLLPKPWALGAALAGGFTRDPCPDLLALQRSRPQEDEVELAKHEETHNQCN